MKAIAIILNDEKSDDSKDYRIDYRIWHRISDDDEEIIDEGKFLSVKIIDFDAIREEHPYATSDRESYDQFNQGWEQAIMRIERIVGGTE